MSFSNRLSLILEEQATQCGDLLDVATDLVGQIDRVKQHLSDLKRKLALTSRRINTNLATIVRRENPSLNISVTADGCKIGYKTKTLILNPDVSRGLWSVDSNDDKFSGRFKRTYRRHTILVPDIGDLSSAVIDYFRMFYKSLNEDIIGTGITLIDGKSVTLCELVEFCEKPEW
jgi:hypothetical protein